MSQVASIYEALVGDSCERDCKYILMLKQERRQRKTDTDSQTPNISKSLQKVGRRDVNGRDSYKY